MKTLVKLGIITSTTLLLNCAAVVKTAKTVLDVGDAVCDVLASDDVKDERVTVTCNYIDKADGVSKFFVAKVPPTSPIALAAKPRGVAPSPVLAPKTSTSGK